MGNWTQVPLFPTFLIPSIQINTITGQVHSGNLLIHDPISQIIVLSSQSRATNGIDNSSQSSLLDIQIIKISSIKDVRLLPVSKDTFKPYEGKPISLADVKQREELAQKRALEEERRLGIGVTPEGQKIYDAFAKTYPLHPSLVANLVDSRWNGLINRFW
jgi:Anticodon-binding domain